MVRKIATMVGTAALLTFGIASFAWSAEGLGEREAVLNFYKQSPSERHVLVFGDGRLYFDRRGTHHDNWPRSYFCAGRRECEPDWVVDLPLRSCHFPESYFEAVILANEHGFIKVDGAEYEAAMRLVQPGGRVIAYCDQAYESLHWSNFRSRNTLTDDDVKRIDEALKDNVLALETVVFFNRGVSPRGERLAWISEVFADDQDFPSWEDALRRRIRILNLSRADLAREIPLPRSLRSLYFSKTMDLSSDWRSKITEREQGVVLTLLKKRGQ